MTTHKTDDYKNSAVKCHLNDIKGDGYKKTCKIFDCKKSTIYTTFYFLYYKLKTLIDYYIYDKITSIITLTTSIFH